MSRWPLRQARIRAVSLAVSCWNVRLGFLGWRLEPLCEKANSYSEKTWRLTKAPAASSCLAMLCLPLLAATSIGVRPSWLAMCRLPVLLLKDIIITN